MSNNLPNIKSRVLYLAEIKGLGKQKFCEQIGLTYGNFTGKSKETPLNSNSIGNILTIVPDANPAWLLTGNGEPLIENKGVKLHTDITIKHKAIPLVKQQAVAGFGNADFAIDDADVKDYYVVPKFKDRRIDFMIEVSGSSMYPKYNSGDIVACRILRESKALQWNKVHVVATIEQGMLVKRIKKSEDANCLLMVSDNKDYDPFDLPKDEITGVAIVVGVIRLE